MYILDTNALIYFLKNEAHAAPVIEDLLGKSAPIYISTITELELFAYPRLTVEDIRNIEDVLKLLAIIALDSHIARIAGQLRRLYGLKTPDSAIAATTLFTGSTLVTRNINDFKRVKGLKLLKI